MDWVEGSRVVRLVDLAVGRVDRFLAYFGERYLKRSWKRARECAMASDPFYADIQRLRRRDTAGIVMFDPNDPRLGWEAWEYQNSVEAVFHRNHLLLAMARWASNHPFSRVMNDFIAARQRAQRGWDFKALYSLDHHLATTLGPQLMKAAEDRKDREPTWLDEMRLAGEQLSMYAQKDDIVLGDSVSPQDMLTVETDIANKAKEAIHWVASNLTKLSK